MRTRTSLVVLCVHLSSYYSTARTLLSTYYVRLFWYRVCCGRWQAPRSTAGTSRSGVAHHTHRLSIDADTTLAASSLLHYIC